MNIAIFVIVTMYMFFGWAGTRSVARLEGDNTDDAYVRKTCKAIFTLMIPLFILSLIKLFT